MYKVNNKIIITYTKHILVVNLKKTEININYTVYIVLTRYSI